MACDQLALLQVAQLLPFLAKHEKVVNLAPSLTCLM